MEDGRWSKRLWDGLKKYRLAALVLLTGIFLMTFPSTKSVREKPVIVETAKRDLGAELSLMLSQAEGAGEVTVLLTEAEGEETLFQKDTELQSERSRQNTVVITDGARSQNGLICRVDPPRYLGAVIICSGADRAATRLELIKAVSVAAGLRYDQITILKRK